MELIRCVRAHPILWDAKHTHYRDVRRKRAIWNLVARQCGTFLGAPLVDGEEARQLWLKLRNSHREARRRRAEDKNLKPWKYEEEMEFLVKDESSTTNDFSVVNADDNEFNGSYKIEVVELGADETDQEINYNEAMVDAVRERFNDEVKIEDVKSKRLIDRSTQYEGTNEGSYNNVQIQTNRLNRDRERYLNGDRERDGLTALFSSMCEKTRNLSKLLQIQVQREIFESVMRAEEETLKIPTSRFMFRKRIANKRKRTRAATFKDCAKEDTRIQEPTGDPPSDPIGEFEIKTENNEHNIA